MAASTTWRRLAPSRSAADPARTVIVIVAAAVLAAGSLAVSISVGAEAIDLTTIWLAMTAYDGQVIHQGIVRDIRLPRALTGAMVGACFAVAGAIMQGMTRNPLASPTLLGLNAGAQFAIVVVLAAWPWFPLNWLIVAAFVGAALGAGLAMGIGSLARGGLTPARLALSGVAVGTLLGSLTSGLVILYELGEEVLFFFAGGVAGVHWSEVWLLLPWFVVGLLMALLLSRGITILSLGDEVAVGLGQRTRWTRLAGACAVLLLVGAAVWVGGPVGFIGLVAPHLARFLVGLDYRRIIPTAALLGMLLFTLADTIARLVNPPYELPVGAVTAMIGVPFFLYLARRDRRGI